MSTTLEGREGRVAVLVDCDNVQPRIIEHALHVAAQFGRVVVRRGYGNNGTLGGSGWREVLVSQAFTPFMQYQYASGKNTSDIALALDAMELLFDETVDVFCLVTSDSDFAYLCRKLRERGASLCVVGEKKTPDALRNAADHFSEWRDEDASPVSSSTHTPETTTIAASPIQKQRPMGVVRAVALLAAERPDGKVDLSALGSYLRRTDSSFSPNNYGHSGLLAMLKTYDLLQLVNEGGQHWSVMLDQDALDKSPINPLQRRHTINPQS